MIVAILLAAGSGQRAGPGAPKQFRPIGQTTPLDRSLDLLVDHPAIEAVLPVLRNEDLRGFAPRHSKILPPVRGGKSRQASVLAGLEALNAHRPELVLIHDAARPFCSPALIDRCIEAARLTGAAVPGLPVTDTMVRVDGGRIAGAPLPREALARVQTPQAFRYQPLLAAHRATRGGATFTDDGTLMAATGAPVAVVAGEEDNFKLTTVADFDRARRFAESAHSTRVGSGYDVHAFGPGKSLWLGGIEIAHECGLVGHSDADVLLHAVTDAILGTIADGDIGAHFPPSDEQWRGAASSRFLADAIARLAARGGRVVHVDTTLVCEAPRIGPHRDAMRASIAAIIGCDIGRISVKATTSERLGFTGRREGIAAMATVTVLLPETGASHD